MTDYQNTKPQKIRFHVTAGAENIDLVNDLIGHLAKAKIMRLPSTKLNNVVVPLW